MKKKKPATEENYDEKKKENSVTFMYFNRFLMLRYFTAFMFFTNIYWFGMTCMLKSWTAVIPGLLALGGIAVTIELTSKLHTKKGEVPVSKCYYAVQSIVNVAIIIVSFTPAYDAFFPFLKNQGQIFVIIIALAGLVMSLLVFRRIRQIEEEKDRQLKVIKMFEKNN